MALVYADASALVKLVRDEPETASLNAFLEGSDLVSSELVVAEVPRAVWRAVAGDRTLSLEQLLARAEDLLDGLALLPVDRELLASAGSVTEPALRALDAIHVVSALELMPIDAFVSYDIRQAAAARLAGLRTMAPGA